MRNTKSLLRNTTVSITSCYYLLRHKRRHSGGKRGDFLNLKKACLSKEDIICGLEWWFRMHREIHEVIERKKTLGG